MLTRRDLLVDGMIQVIPGVEAVDRPGRATWRSDCSWTGWRSRSCSILTEILSCDRKRSVQCESNASPMRVTLSLPRRLFSNHQDEGPRDGLSMWNS